MTKRKGLDESATDAYRKAARDAYIERVVAEAPPLSPEQIDRLSILLRPEPQPLRVSKPFGADHD